MIQSGSFDGNISGVGQNILRLPARTQEDAAFERVELSDLMTHLDNDSVLRLASVRVKKALENVQELTELLDELERRSGR